MAPDCQQNSKNKYMSNNYCLNFRHDFTNEFLTGMIQVTACKFSQKKMNFIGLILSSKIKQLFSLRLQRYISAVCDLEPCGRKISLTGIPLTDFKMVAKLFLRWLLVLYYSSTRRYLLCMHNVFIKQPCWSSKPRSLIHGVGLVLTDFASWTCSKSPAAGIQIGCPGKQF